LACDSVILNVTDTSPVHSGSADHSDQPHYLPLITTLALLVTTSSPTTPVEDIAGLPPGYADFADVFSKAGAEHLAPHCPYDLSIDLEDRAQPRLGPIYSLSPPELKQLHSFIDKHLSLGFICSTTSSFGAPVLFVKKKDGSLHLCVDF
jgi:hypothetical protein